MANKNDTTMPALVYSGPNEGVGLATRPVPHLSEGDDVLVRVAATGICGTDRGIVLGSFPATPGVILGHEAVGHVAAAGIGVASVSLGDPVAINPTYYCGRCVACRHGKMAYCLAKQGREIGVDCDGTMAAYIKMPEAFVHRLPTGMSLRRAVQIEPLACVLNNLAAANPQPGDRALILGGGPIGTLCALVLASRGTRVSLAECDPQRAGLARAMLPPSVNILTAPAEVDSQAPNVIIDAVGTLLEVALGIINNAGTIVIMGEHEGAVAELGLRAVATRGIRVIGAGPYPPAAFELAIDLASELPMESLITHELPLQHHAHAFKLLAADLSSTEGYRAMKVLLVSDEQRWTS